ncbi:MAG: BioY family protein [Pseudomonadota bacterium]|jgi:biotin transport system substrate-specific component
MYSINSTKYNYYIIETIKVIIGAFVIGASAQISIPLKPVNITLQTMVVMAIGLTYSKQSSFYTMGLYLTLGVLGLPVFTNWHSGLAVLGGPSAGYLIGMLAASYIMPFLRERYNTSDFYNCLLGSFVIYVLGISWLSTFVGIRSALYSGFLVYVPTGLAKIALLVWILRLMRRG